MTTTPPHHDLVIVGGGPAAATLVMTLRQLGHDGDVVVFSEEDRLPYDRTVVSKGLLEDDPTPPPLLFTEELATVTRTHSEVVRIDPDQHRVELADSHAVGFDRLVLATGAAPWVPPIDGVDAPDVSLLRSAASGEALRDHLGEGRRLVIVGGGVIGLEVAAVARTRGTAVTVLESAPVPMSRVLPATITEPLLEVHRGHGVTIHLGVLPTAIEGDGATVEVRCQDGPTIQADHVLVATGARPRTQLARAACLDVDDGIMVDELLTTSHPAIFAIGDVARLRAADGSTTRSEAYTAAMSMGQHLARHLTGNPTPYREVPWSWSDQYDLTLQATGWPDRATTWVVRGSVGQLEAGLVALGLAEDRLVAAAGISRGRAVGRVVKGAQALIGAGLTVTPAQLEDPTVDLRRLSRGDG